MGRRRRARGGARRRCCRRSSGTARSGAWIVDDTGFPKKGRHSVGVARQYCGQLGKQDNCQVAVTLSVANEHASLPVAFRLYLPEAWADDPARRAKAGVPEDVAFRTKPQIALEQFRRRWPTACRRVSCWPTPAMATTPTSATGCPRRPRARRRPGPGHDRPYRRPARAPAGRRRRCGPGRPPEAGLRRIPSTVNVVSPIALFSCFRPPLQQFRVNLPMTLRHQRYSHLPWSRHGWRRRRWLS